MFKQLRMANSIKFSLDNLPSYSQLYAYAKGEAMDTEVHQSISMLLASRDPKQIEAKEIVTDLLKGVHVFEKMYGKESITQFSTIVKSLAWKPLNQKLSLIQKPSLAGLFDSKEVKSTMLESRQYYKPFGSKNH